jgi:hypothetical protein
MSNPDLEQLLQRARSTAPRVGSKDRLRPRILSGAAAVGVVAITGKAAGAGASALLAAAGKSGSGLLLSVLACVGGGVVAGLWLIGPALSSDHQSPRAHSPVPVARTVASAPVPTSAAGSMERPVVDTPLAVPPSRVALLAPSADAAPAMLSIQRETELLAEAQRALRRGDAATALGYLDLYDAEFPRGALSQEGSAQRIVSWCSLGRKAEGLRALDRFRTTYPGSALLPRLTAACGNVGSRDDFELESSGSSTDPGDRSEPTSGKGRKLNEK